MEQGGVLVAVALLAGAWYLARSQGGLEDPGAGFAADGFVPPDYDFWTGESQPLEDASEGVAVASGAVWLPPARAQPYVGAIRAAEIANGIPRDLLLRQIAKESNFNPRARSGAGAAGIAQFMPGTARDYNLDPWDPFASIAAAGRYMRDLYRQTGSWVQALAAYNFGIGRVLRGDAWPAETRDYVAVITADVPVA